MEARRPAYGKIQYVSFLAAMAVLYCHAGNWAHFGLGEESAAYAFEWKVIDLTMWAVPFFFMASGYLFFHGFTMGDLLPKWKRRVRTLLVPYLVWNTLYYLYYAVFLRIPPVSRILTTEPVELSLQAAFNGVFHHSCLGVMWYVQLLMVFVLLAPAFYMAFMHRTVGGICICALLLLLAFQVPFPVSFASMSWESLFFYAAGAYLGLCFPDLPGRVCKKGVRIGAGLMLIALAAFSTFVVKPSLYAAAVIVLLWIAVGEGPRPRFLYTTSFFLYASHMMLSQVPEKLLGALLPMTDFGAVIAYLSSPVLTCALVGGIAYGLYRFLPMLYGLLTGGRGRRKPVLTECTKA